MENSQEQQEISPPPVEHQDHPPAVVSETTLDNNNTDANEHKPIPLQRPSSATSNTHIHHQHNANKDGHFATAKVFATPISFDRPGSAPLSPSSNSKNRNTFVVGGKGGKNINNASYQLPSINNNTNLQQQHQQHPYNGASPIGSGGTLMRGPTHSNAKNRPLSATNIRNLSPTSQQSQLQMKGQSHREHWTNNESPGRAAASAAKEFHDIYSGQSREEAKEDRRQMKIQQHEREYGNVATQEQHQSQFFRQNIINNDGGNALGLKFPIRGRAVGGNHTNGTISNGRPSSAHSNNSSGRGSSNNNNTPRNFRNPNAFPPRKVITAELTALRKKYHQVAEANQRQQQQNQNNRGNNNYSAKSNSNNNNNNKNNQIRSQLDNIMNQIHQNGGVGTRVVDLGTGNPQNNYRPNNNNTHNNKSPSNSPNSLRHPTIPAHIQIDNIVRRTEETAKVMRREDKVAQENDRRIRNFRARALVQTATEMQRAKRDEELKDINDKLVWEKMKRDALEGQIYDLKERLEALKFGGNSNNNKSSTMMTKVNNNNSSRTSSFRQ